MLRSTARVKENEIIDFAGKRMLPRMTVLSEAAQTHKDKGYKFSLSRAPGSKFSDVSSGVTPETRKVEQPIARWR